MRGLLVAYQRIFLWHYGKINLWVHQQFRLVLKWQQTWLFHGKNLKPWIFFDRGICVLSFLAFRILFTFHLARYQKFMAQARLMVGLVSTGRHVAFSLQWPGKCLISSTEIAFGAESVTYSREATTLKLRRKSQMPYFPPSRSSSLKPPML